MSEMDDDTVLGARPMVLPIPPLPVGPNTGIEGLNDHDARLIWDLVSKMRPATDVLTTYGLTPADLRAKAGNELWASAYREAEKLWTSDMNIQQRIRLKAAFLLEDSLAHVFSIVSAQGISLTNKLEAVEKLIKISTVANVPKEGPSGEKHNITINIGGGVAPIKVVAETNSGTAELTAG